MAIFRKNKPERIFGLQVRCKVLDIFKIKEFFEKLSGTFLDFLREFFGKNFLGDVFGRIFLGEFFGRNYLVEEFFGRNFLGRNSLFTLLFEYENNT